MNLVVEKLSFAYPSDVFQLQIDHFEVHPGQAVFLKGASGSGKTTLLHLMSGILVPQTGRVRHGGHSLGDWSESQRRRHRLEYLGVIFQTLELLPYLSAEENVLLPLQFRSGGRPDRNDRDRAGGLLNRLGLWDRRRDKPEKLSQGECQRVAVARALVAQPRLILADEPTSSLDAGHRDGVMNLLCDEVRERQAALLVASHDVHVLARLTPGIDLEADARLPATAKR